MKQTSKGFSTASRWTWIKDSELERKKKLAQKVGVFVPGCAKFCYSDRFYVMFFERQTEWGLVMHMMIVQHDKKKIPNHWEALQQIKNELVGTHRLAIEVYPPESELVNDMNAYHLWVLPPGFKLPFGLNPGWLV